MASLKPKNETVVLRIIYNNKHNSNVPSIPAACGGTGSSVKRSENWSSIGLGRQTTTSEEIIIAQ